jgi:hypothetical protein
MASRLKTARLRPMGTYTAANGTAPEALITAGTVVLEVRFCAPSFVRTVKARDLVSAEGVDPDILHIEMDLIDPKVLSKISTHQGRFVDRWLNMRSLTSSVLRGGMRLVTLPLVEEVTQGIDDFAAERAALVEELAAGYDDHIAAARARQGNQFNAANYPRREELKWAFRVERRFLSLSVPTSLEGLNPTLVREERARLERDMARAGEEVMAALRSVFAGLVLHLTDRLGVDPATGKPNIFRDSGIQPMFDFLATFEARNVMGDQALATLVGKARKLLDGVAPEDLRTNTDLRGQVLKAGQDIAAKLAAMDVVPRGRKFAADGEV